MKGHHVPSDRVARGIEANKCFEIDGEKHDLHTQRKVEALACALRPELAPASDDTLVGQGRL